MNADALMPREARSAVRDALGAVGYEDKLIDEDYPSSLEVSYSLDRPSTAPVVAFWDSPLDQFTSAIAVAWTPTGQSGERHLRQTAEGLWAPYAVLARPSGCELWETLPAGPVSGGAPVRPISQPISYDQLARVLVGHREQLNPKAVAARKRPWRQMALYEYSPEQNSFFQWAYEPTRQRVTDVFVRLLRDALELAHGHDGSEAACLRWALRMVGVRLIWDKGWVKRTGSPASADDLLEAAFDYPVPVGDRKQLPVPIGREVAQLAVSHLGMMNLRAADRGILSQVIQGRGLPQTLQQRWRFYPTPPDIAWRMLESLPIETLPSADRRVWDGTCGTGTFLVAALDRLRPLVPEGQDLARYLTSAIGGNEIQPALADATRIALDQALGEPAGREWQITTHDVHETPTETGERPPTIIVSNPPFHGGGRTEERAVGIIGRYLESLAHGGLAAVVVPRTSLSSNVATGLRERILSDLEMFEVWELPARVFPNTDTEVAVLLGRKLPIRAAATNAVTWRAFNQERSEQWLSSAQQVAWTAGPRAAILPPLALALDKLFADHSRLLDFVPTQNRSQGITPGRWARESGDVLREPKPGSEPYLVGRARMPPFYIPWSDDPRWLRYTSPRLHRPRGQYEWLFREPKVIVSRQATRGATWRVRAAVDRRGLFPSDRFYALKPTGQLSLDLVTGLLNSLLANAWLRMANPAFNARLDAILALPVPTDPRSPSARRVETLSRRLAAVWEKVHTERTPRGGGATHALHEAEALTLELDAAVFETYGVPAEIRDELSEYFRWLGGSRPGFHGPVVPLPRQEGTSWAVEFSAKDAERMEQLFDERDDRELTAEEDAELRRLLERAQRAELTALNRRRGSVHLSVLDLAKPPAASR